MPEKDNLFYVKLYKKSGEVLVAVADKELLGKTFKKGKIRIEVSRSFYEGDVLEEEGLLARLRFATIANLVGKKCIAVAIKHGYINKKCIIYIGKVPHAQIIRMR